MRHIKPLLTNFFNPKRGLARTLLNADIRRILFVVRVEGESMWPALIPGRRYFASGIGVVRVGDFAVFRNPRETSRIFIKRAAAAREGGYIMESAVSWGASSRDFGPVPRQYIIGKVLQRFSVKNDPS